MMRCNAMHHMTTFAQTAASARPSSGRQHWRRSRMEDERSLMKQDRAWRLTARRYLVGVSRCPNRPSLRLSLLMLRSAERARLVVVPALLDIDVTWMPPFRDYCYPAAWQRFTDNNQMHGEEVTNDDAYTLGAASQNVTCTYATLTEHTARGIDVGHVDSA